jgi:class 3 adenylate cyclase
VNHLISDLAGCDGPQEMLTRAGQTLDDLVNPESCVIYARVGDDYAPVFMHGNAIPPAFSEDSGLVEELHLRRDPLAGEALTRTVRRVDLSPVERASLEALAAAVIIPLRSSNTLIALLCLGPKRSGDIYTSTDLALLGAVAAQVSAELSRFTEVELTRHKMEMYETIRSYVPRAITEELESGRSIEPHRRDVSVMFVDIRGYTGYAEERNPEEIFSILNRYTEIVSTIVGKHGGSLVEFSGDGIMAVFGAPQELPEKEQAALNAARALSAAMAGLDLGPDSGSESLEVGIGIATGEALVGNIRSVDRLIWSAIGNTTNLAARLQALSRDMDAGIVIDGATQRATPDDTSDFVHHPRVRIRGRREISEVYTLARNITTR